MYLESCNLIQLERLYRKAYHKMTERDGYQPFGYDWITLKITRPGWYSLLRHLLFYIKKRKSDATD